MTDRLIHRRLKRAVGQIAGAGFFKAAADLGLGHQRGPWAIFSMRAKIC